MPIRSRSKLKDAGIRADVDDGRDRMQAKIRNAQLKKVPFMLVIGKREAEAGAVAIRLRTGEDLGAIPVEQADSDDERPERQSRDRAVTQDGRLRPHPL